jgi:F-type H+-transporting ATPase subunit delta
MATLKLDDLKIAQNYAKALLSCASSDDDAEQLYDNLVQLKAVVTEVPELVLFLANPQVCAAEKDALVNDHLTNGQDVRVVSLVRILLENNRPHLLAGIADQYESLLNQRTQTAKAKLTTAVEIPATLEKKVQQSLQSLYGYHSVEIEAVVDPDILGGAIVQIDDHLIDGSYRNRLQQLAKSF